MCFGADMQFPQTHVITRNVGKERRDETGVRNPAPQQAAASSGDEVPRRIMSLTFVVTEHSPVVFRSRLGSMEPLQFSQLPPTQCVSKRHHMRAVEISHE